MPKRRVASDTVGAVPPRGGGRTLETLKVDVHSKARLSTSLATSESAMAAVELERVQAGGPAHRAASPACIARLNFNFQASRPASALQGGPAGPGRACRGEGAAPRH